MNELAFIGDSTAFQAALLDLRLLRRASKMGIKVKRKYRLSKSDRKAIHAKTEGRCHVCGQPVSLDKFEADHVRPHSTGGHNLVDNFLATCKTCNNCRWDYSPDEIKWILKIGIWTRKQIEDKTPLGQDIGKAFIKYDTSREKRRKTPRIISSDEREECLE